MTLADAIQNGVKDEVQALADYLVAEFEVTERVSSGDDPTAAPAKSVASAMGAWAYMKLNAANQGD